MLCIWDATTTTITKKKKNKRGKKRWREIFDNNVQVFLETWCDMLNVDTFISNAFLMLYSSGPTVRLFVHIPSTLSIHFYFILWLWDELKFTLSHPFTRKVCMEFRAYVSFWPMEWFKLLRAPCNKTKANTSKHSTDTHSKIH